MRLNWTPNWEGGGEIRHCSSVVARRLRAAGIGCGCHVHPRVLLHVGWELLWLGSQVDASAFEVA